MTIKIDPNKSEKANIAALFVHHINTQHPNKQLELTENDISIGTPVGYGDQSNSYWDTAHSVSGVNNLLKPNSEVSFAITKPDYKGVVPAKIYYHRYHLQGIMKKMFRKPKDFLGHDTFEAAGITVDASGVDAFKQHLATKISIVDTNLRFGFYEDHGNNAKYFTVGVEVESVLYVPESSFSIRATPSDTLPFIDVFKS